MRWFVAVLALVCASTLPAQEMGMSGGVDFEKQILPLLETKCFECHSDLIRKPKGRLRLDSPESIRAGGKGGPALRAGKPELSSLYTRAALPDDHDDVMPPSGEVWSKEELNLVRQWIADGADFGKWKGQGEVASGLVKRTDVDAGKTRDRLKVFRTLEESAAAPSSSAVKAMEEAGARVAPVLPKGKLLRVEFVRNAAEIDDQALARIAPLARNVAILSLRGAAVTDKAFAVIAKLPNLVRLDMPNTKISDAGLQALSKAKPAHLRSVNFYGTSITDRGLDSLVSLPALEKVYVWDTKVTAAGADSFGRMKKGCTVQWTRELPKAAERNNDGNNRRRR